MKKYLSILFLFFISCKENRYRFKKYHDVLYEGQCIAIPEYYRRIIGYDSVQFIDFMDRPEANFCYPNKWLKYIDYGSRLDTILVDSIHNSILKDSILTIDRFKCNIFLTMKKLFPLLLLVITANVYGQTKDTIKDDTDITAWKIQWYYDRYGKIILSHTLPSIDSFPREGTFTYQPMDTFPRPKIVLYGIAGIIKEDSSKIFYKRYLFYKNRGDSVRAKRYRTLLEKYKH